MIRRACLTVALAAIGCSSPGATHEVLAAASSTPAPASTAVAAKPAGSSPLTLAPPLSARGEAALARTRLDLYASDDRFRIDPPKGETVEDTFFVLAADRAAPLDAALAETRTVVEAMWHGPMQHRLEQCIRIWAFSTHQAMADAIHAHAPGARTDGFGVYWPPTHEIYFTTEGAGIGTLGHELLHPLVREGDFPTAPLWLSEGLAALYESFDVPDAAAPYALRPLPHFRVRELRHALRSPDTADAVRIDTLFGLADGQFRAEEALDYARARELLRWLYQRGELWSFYRRWRDDVVTDRSGVRSFEGVTGMTVAQANAAWREWLVGPWALVP